MSRSSSKKITFYYSIIGIAAILVPVILMLINFQPLGFLVKKTNPSPINLSSPAPTMTTNSTGTAILNNEEFTLLQKNPSYFVIDTTSSKPKSAVGLKISSAELKVTISQKSPDELKTLFKTQTLILITSDLVDAQEIATQLKEKDFLVMIYFSNEN